MKVAILTFHRAHNCGAMLQCFALQTVLERMGHTVQVLDCNSIGEEGRFRDFTFLPIRRCIKRVIEFFFSLGTFDLRLKRFNEFRHRNLKLSSRVESDAFPQGYDRYIVGSDQVFQPDLTKESAPMFLLEHVKDDSKKISYAASFGYSSLPVDRRKLYRDFLDKFHAISVRESSGRDIIKNELGLSKPVDVVLDPTLLLSAADYEEVETPVKVPHEYVLVYSIGGAYEKLRSTAKKVTKKYGLEIVYVNACRRHYMDVPFSDYLSISPDRLIYLIHHSRFVVTTSFHGVAFSLIYRRPFLAILPNDSKVSGRIPSLLEEIGLNERVYSENEDIGDADIEKSMADVGHELVLKKLKLAQEHSMRFLRSI